MTDKKLGKGRAGRVTRTDGQSRQSRRLKDRDVSENRQMTDAMRLDEYRKTFYQSVLPDLPEIKGYHVCWLTTTNPRDSIIARMRIGYEPVRADEVPGWGYASLKTGEYAGCIGINEMVAFKLPLHLYEAYMRFTHHEQPLESEGQLRSKSEEARSKAAQISARAEEALIVEEEGNVELGSDRDVPSFSHTLTNRTRPG